MDRPRGRHHWLIIATAGAAALVVGGGLLLATRDRTPEAEVPAAATPTVAPAASASAEDLARGFIDAYGAFDADRAMVYLTDDAIAEMVKWFDPASSGTPEEFRLVISSLEATGFKQTITGCEQLGEAASGMRVRCAFDLHALRSDEIGLGPYTDNYWDLVVSDEEIVSATWNWAFMTNGFSEEMWEPFADWVSAKHPEDVTLMYTDASQTSQRMSQASVRLWEERTREYADEVGR